jgi:hypothetical protein
MYSPLFLVACAIESKFKNLYMPSRHHPSSHKRKKIKEEKKITGKRLRSTRRKKRFIFLVNNSYQFSESYRTEGLLFSPLFIFSALYLTILAISQFNLLGPRTRDERQLKQIVL